MKSHRGDAEAAEKSFLLCARRLCGESTLRLLLAKGANV